MGCVVVRSTVHRVDPHWCVRERAGGRGQLDVLVVL